MLDGHSKKGDADAGNDKIAKQLDKYVYKLYQTQRLSGEFNEVDSDKSVV